MALDAGKLAERNARLVELLARTALSDQRAFAELYRLDFAASVRGGAAYIA